MLEHMGWKEAAELIYSSLEAAVAKKTVTYDLARQMDGAVEVSCSGFARSMVESME
jgi:isocitrate dehydrogenase